jgi:hypothetical protein
MPELAVAVATAGLQARLRRREDRSVHRRPKGGVVRAQRAQMARGVAADAPFRAERGRVRLNRDTFRVTNASLRPGLRTRRPAGTLCQRLDTADTFLRAVLDCAARLRVLAAASSDGGFMWVVLARQQREQDRPHPRRRAGRCPEGRRCSRAACVRVGTPSREGAPRSGTARADPE